MSRGPRRLHSWMLSGGLMLAALPGAHAADPVLPELAAGQTLESALVALNEQGHRITYSNALVRAEMRLASQPRAAEIGALLRELLAPWGLVAEPLPDGGWRVIRAPRAAGAADAETPAQLAEVDVTASRYGLLEAGAGVPLFLDRGEIRGFPHLTDDAFRAMRVLPGVSGGDFSARLHVRGGRRDEVALRVDGVEIHDPFHLRELDGPISLLDTNLVESLDLTTGGMTADFGGRMSGVVDIVTREPALDDASRHAVGVSFVNAFARTGGRFDSGRGYYLLAARKGYLDLVLKRVEDDDEEFAPRYGDLLAKAGYAIGDRTAIAAGLLAGRDDMTFVTADDEENSAGTADTAHLWVTLDHEFANGPRVRTTVSAGDVEQDRAAVKDDPGVLFADLDTERRLRVSSLRQDWTWQFSDRHLLRFGSSFARYRARHDYALESLVLDPTVTGGAPIDTSRNADVIVHTGEFGLWAGWRSRIGMHWFGEVGLRHDRYDGDLDATRLSPRINLVRDSGGARQYRLALSRVWQPERADELQVEDGVTSLFPPERADQLSAGVTQRFGQGATLRIDGYVKRYGRLRPRFENLLDSLELINEAEPDRIRVDARTARARGVELSLQMAPTERSWLWASYVYSEAQDKDGGERIARLWDQAHALSGGWSWTGARWRFSLAWNWHTGWPTTPVLLEETVDGNGEPVIRAEFGGRNSGRLKSFSRIDLRASRSHELASGTLTWYLEVFNLFDSRNPCCIEDFDLVRDSGGTLIARPNHDYWLPVLPSFGIQFEF